MQRNTVVVFRFIDCSLERNNEYGPRNFVWVFWYAPVESIKHMTKEIRDGSQLKADAQTTRKGKPPTASCRVTHLQLDCSNVLFGSTMLASMVLFGSTKASLPSSVKATKEN